MKIQQHDGVVVDAAELRQGFAKLLREERKRCRAAPTGRANRVYGSPKPQVYIGGGEGLRLGCGLQPSPHPSIYRGRRKGAGPL